MNKLLALTLAAALLFTGCGSRPAETTGPESLPVPTNPTEAPETTWEAEGNVVDIALDGQNITVTGATEGVHTSRDIIYYKDRTEYESGYPYGDGDKEDMHSAEEAAAHLVVNITAPGTYRLSGKLDLGQIRIDLGEEAYSNPNAVVNLILDSVEISCTVGPAILFQNVYECDGNWSVENARPDVDTTGAGANLILAENSKNIVNGSYVAKIYKDKEGEKTLWKQDGAVYSYMSMNIYGPGSLDIYAENEGLDTELHLTIFGGNITIRSGNDGINTNEDGVSVTTIRGGDLRIMAGLGEEGDGIDSNGYLVIYGGTVVSAANPAADAGLDSDLGSFIHGGTVLALGAAMDWAESDSNQVTMNLQFAQMQTGDIRITREDGAEIFVFDPASDEVIGMDTRSYQGAIISCADFQVGESYYVFVSDIQMGYTDTDIMRPQEGMMPPEGGQRPEEGMGIPENRDPDNMPGPPESDAQIPPQPGTDMPAVPQGEAPNRPEGQEPPGGFGNPAGEANTLFYMQDKVNFFTGLTELQ